LHSFASFGCSSAHLRNSFDGRVLLGDDARLCEGLGTLAAVFPARTAAIAAS